MDNVIVPSKDGPPLIRPWKSISRGESAPHQRQIAGCEEDLRAREPQGKCTG